MNFPASLVLGLLIGWLVEWAIDWFYWRGRIVTITGENATLKERIRSLEEQVRKGPKPAIFALLTGKDGRDNFQAIKGIGPVFAKRLREAGVHTFEHLSQLTPKEMEEILGTLFKRFFSKSHTIMKQAKEFAGIKAQYQ